MEILYFKRAWHSRIFDNCHEFGSVAFYFCSSTLHQMGSKRICWCVIAITWVSSRWIKIPVLQIVICIFLQEMIGSIFISRTQKGIGKKRVVNLIFSTMLHTFEADVCKTLILIYVDTKNFRESCADPNRDNHLENIINITKSKYSVAFIRMVTP